jgi:osmotically-inducible protein OsmY
MKPHVPLLIAAVAGLAFIALPLAAAASPSIPQVQFSDQTVASQANANNADAAQAGAIVQALNAEPSLKNSKIAVSVEDGSALLTGAALTKAQSQKAREIAVATIGGDASKVTSIIRDDET